MSQTVYIADKLGDDALRYFDSFPELNVDNRPGLPLEEKLAAVKGAHALIVRSATQVDKQLLEAAENLRVVVRAGVGVDNVDLDTATRRGVVVQNVPDGNTRSAAEHTIALILALARNVPQAQASLLGGEWERGKFVGIELQGKSIGVIGLGKIGRHVATMAKGLGFKVLGYDPYLTEDAARELGVTLVEDIGDLASQSDFLTIHVPKTASTKALIGPEVLAKAKTGLRVINCARGGIVDEAALLEALQDGRVAGAAVDVFETEPPEDRRLIEHPAVVATPHLGASTQEAQQNVAVKAAEFVVDYLLHQKLHAPVNTSNLAPELREALAPYGKLAIRMGRLHGQIIEGKPARIVVKFFGDDFENAAARNYVVSEVLVGFLEGKCADLPNSINARSLAAELGLTVEASHQKTVRYFDSMICVEVHDENGSREVGGTTRGRGGVRLVRFEDFYFDSVFEGRILLSANQDVPGMVGKLGTTLAKYGINISQMSLGRQKGGGQAFSVVCVDDVDPESLSKASAELVDEHGFLWCRSVDVGPR